jgi:8-oxo-dGTP pyrophosphatase MutT (NUDIX family)
MGEAGESRASEGAQAGPDGTDDGATGGAKDGAKRRRRRRGSGRRAQGATAGGERTVTSTRRKGTAVRATSARTKNAKGAKSGKAAKGAARTRTKRGRPKRAAVPTKREVSAGGVVYRPSDDGIEIVLASRRTRRGQLAWGLAKGGIEGDESMEDAAVREVREETGLLAEIEASLGETRYFYVWEDVRIRKTVHFFLMRHTGGDIDDRDDEMEEIRWFPLERALKRAAYRGERDVLGRAAELLR